MPAHLIAEEGAHRGLVFSLEEGEERIIGRDPDEAFFVLEDVTVSRRQARLIFAPEGVYLENLSRVSPTLINEEPIDGHVLLKEGDRVQMGRTIFLFSEKEAPSTKEKQKKQNGYEEIFGALDEPLEPFARDLTQHSTKASSSSGYETIFEDKVEDEPLPFHLLPETPFLLKVVSGPNAGAEIGLEKNKSYIIGKDPLQAEIVLQDLSVSRKHAKITIDDQGIVFIEDLGSKNGTYVQSILIQTTTAVSSQEMISLGTSSFYILDRESPQETIYSSIPSFAKEEKKEEKIAPPQEEAPQIIEEVLDWKKKPIPLQYLVLASSCLVIGLILFLTLFSLFKSSPMETAAKHPEEIIEKALAKFEGVESSFNPASGKLFLVGHILTSVDLEEMLYRVDSLDFVTSVENHVVIDELVDRMMNDLLSSNPAFRGVVIQSVKPGRFVAMGSVETAEEASSLSDYLAVNFPYLDRLESQVAIQEVINLQVEALLMQKGFSSLSFQLTNGEIILSGNYSNQKTDAFEATLKEIRAISGIRGIKNYALPTNPNQAAINLSQNFKVTGTALYNGKGYSVVLNGRVYEVGSFISGMIITEIDPETILLEKDGIKYKINYMR